MATFAVDYWEAELRQLSRMFGRDEIASIRRILRESGFSAAWVLDDGDGAEYFFVVPSEELANVDGSAVSWRLTEALPRRKAQITDFDGRRELRVRLL